LRKSVIQFDIEKSRHRDGAVNVTVFALHPIGEKIVSEWEEYYNWDDLNALLRKLSDFLEKHLKNAFYTFTKKGDENDRYR